MQSVCKAVRSCNSGDDDGGPREERVGGGEGRTRGQKDPRRAGGRRTVRRRRRPRSRLEARGVSRALSGAVALGTGWFGRVVCQGRQSAAG